MYDLFEPITSRYRDFTAPIRNAWANYSDRNPNEARIFGWIGKAIKWGFYFVLFLVFLTWMGVFGRIPSTNELKQIETAKKYIHLTMS
jgi:hypothetical protein